MSLVLVSTSEDRRFTLSGHAVFVVGRELTSTLPIFDPAVSRRHVDCVFRYDGAPDKFIGDAIMAYRGAPESVPIDADHAVSAAVDVQRALHTLNEGWAVNGRAQLAVGIGIHMGDAFVGNIGSPCRREFTLISDTVRADLSTTTTSIARHDLAIPRQYGAPQAIWQVVTP